MVLLSDLMERYIAAVADDMRVRDQVVCENLRRIRLGALLVLPIFIVAAVLLLPGTWQAHDGAVVSWKLAVGLTHLASLCCALVIAVLAHRALHRVDADYGGIDTYLVDVLGLDTAARKELAQRYLQAL